MKRFLFVALSAILLLSAFAPGPASTTNSKGKDPDTEIVEFDIMVGIPQAFTGTQNPIRGINGGGLPWKLSSASGQLKDTGELEIKIKGLVLAAGPNTDSNPVASFRAIVSCLGDDGSVQNVMTNPFPATTGPASSGGGNAKIKTTVSLPQPCIAPLIFVTSPNGAWFAVTGF